MPEPDVRIAVTGVIAEGRWRARDIAERVTLFVEAAEVVIRLGDADELAEPLDRLTGAEWRGDRLTLHVAPASLTLTGATQLDRAWVAITGRACRVPELTRGLRTMGGRHGGGDTGSLHARYFAPLLQARRRLESDEPLDWRVGSVDVRALEERLRGLLVDAAAERHPERPAHRRGLEAELFEAADPVFDALTALSAAATTLLSAPEAERFLAWRAWSVALRRLFSEADRRWGAIRATLEGTGSGT